MNTRNRITLLLAAIIVVALLVVGMTLTTSAANEGDLVTEYGVVPAEHANNNFAIFHKAEGAKEYTFLTSVSDAFSDAAFTNYRNLTGELVALALKDATCGSLETPALINANLVFDLGDKVITAPSTGNKGLIMARASAVSSDRVMNITVKNGTISHGKDNVVLLGATAANSSVLGGNKLHINLTFSEVTFDQIDGTTTDWVIVQAANTHADDKALFTNTVLFDECVFDTTGIASGTHILFCGWKSSFHNYTIEVKGGEIYMDSVHPEIARNSAVCWDWQCAQVN